MQLETKRLVGPLTTSLSVVNVAGVRLEVCDLAYSVTNAIVCDEIARDSYGLRNIDFEDGDVVIDIGAHVGLFSIYLAKRYPFLSIISVEPAPWNFINLQRNLLLNHIDNVTPCNVAITSDARRLRMCMTPCNTGGASGFMGTAAPAEHEWFWCRSTTLDALFRDHEITLCKLLKIDCEGAEHEILKTASVLSGRIAYLSGEFHENVRLRALGHTNESLISFVHARMSAANVCITQCEMSS